MAPVAWMAVHAASVEKYYDVNSAAFAHFGQGAGTGTIRRPVWAPDVHSELDAFSYIDNLVLAEIEGVARCRSEPVRVVDLGCGLGGSLCFLAQRSAIAGVGVTVSRVQAELARARAQHLGLDGQLRFQHGDFVQPLRDVPRAHVVFSFEAFVHAPTPEEYFSAAAKLVTPGGALIICDDVLVPPTTGELSGRQADWLDKFRRGWLAPSLVTHDRLLAAAAQAGFVMRETRELTSYLQLDRPRDRVLRMLLPILDHLPVSTYRRQSWRGGDALQRCLRAGLIAYRYMTWTRQC